MPLLFVGFAGLIVLVVGMVLKEFLTEAVKAAVKYSLGKIRAWRGKDGLR